MSNRSRQESCRPWAWLIFDVSQKMNDDFHLIDLVSQAPAVQRLLRGMPPKQKLAWLAERGRVEQVPKIPGAHDTYWFESPVGAKCAFFVSEDRFVFIGDHTTFTVSDDRGEKMG